MAAPVEWIDVRVPYEPHRKLDRAYDRAVRESRAEWVLLLDHDVFLCNPYWYLICLKAVNMIHCDPRAALITCVTNGVHRANRTPQRADKAPNGMDLACHIAEAHRLYAEQGDKVVCVNWPRITGFFMLLRRSTVVHDGVEFTRGTTGKIDWNLGTQLRSKGFSIWLLPGLYVYHNRGMIKRGGSWADMNLPIAEYAPC